MENYMNSAAKNSAWTARAGVVVDLEPPLSARSGSLRNTGQDGRPTETQNSSSIQNGNEGTGSLPIMNAAVPSNMFMQTVNFDVALKNQILQNNGMNTSDGQLDRSIETSMDLLEQQQAIEQARLLQRFKELRQMQLQQQELLMQQQKNQLDALKEEQKQVQTLLAKQRQNKWGGKPNGAIKGQSNWSTPPLRKNQGPVHSARQTTESMGSSKLMQPESNAQDDSTQLSGQLPRPVIYVPLDDETDEIKTNPDLFSDTNSYVGSLATTEEGIYPVPESASEASGDVYRPNGNKQKPLKCPKLKPAKHHREITKDHISDFHDISRTIDLEEPDEGIGTQSLRSSGQIEQQDHVDEEDSDDDQDVGNVDDVDDLSDDEDELEEQILDDEDESEDENQNNTCIETGAIQDDVTLRPEDRPITGIGGKKTFEELLEEQLRAEEEKLKTKPSESSPPSESPKRAFLKKGVGLSRFGLAGNQKPSGKTVINKANVKSTLPQGAIVTSKSDQKNKSKQQPAEKKSTKTSPKTSNSTQSGKKSPPASPGRGQVQTNLKLNAKTGNQKSTGKEEITLQHGNAKTMKSPPTSPGRGQVQTSLKLIAKTGNSKSTGKEETLPHSKGKKMSDKVHINKHSVKIDPLRDDASFIDKIEQRERNKEFEQEDLEEFEMLEDFADNASFCSNSSIVQRVLERDKIRSRFGKLPQSPRTSVAQQIALASRKDELKKKIEQTVPEEPSKQIMTEIAKKEKGKNPEDSDSDKLSDSSDEDTSESEEESSELSEDSDDGGDESPVKHVTNESNGARTRNTCKYDESDDSSSSDDGIGTDNIIKSPSKIMTRKIASKEDRTTLNTVTNLLQKLNSGSLRKGDTHDDSLNSSSFVPQAKSPIVISRDTVTSKGASSGSNIPETDEVEFQLHSQFSSHAKHSSPMKVDDDKSDSEMSETSSYKALNISAKISKTNTSKGAIIQNMTSAQSKSKEIEFDDEEEWGDTTLKDARDKKTDSDMDIITENLKSQVIKDSSNIDTLDTNGTPPTSKLVTKLFPKLKPQPTKQQQQEQQQLQIANTTAVGDGIQSKVLREKLAELEKEIEKFRNENATLERQRKEREEALSKLKKEMAAFEKEKNEELNRIQEYKNEEMKKIRHEKKMFEKYQKASRNMPDKKEREEIGMLKTQLSELQEEMKRKESRWTSSNSRLRSKLEQLEQENSELKEEIKMMEKKRLEWLQREQTSNKGKMKSQQPQRNYQQDLIATNSIQKTSADFQTTDSDEEKDPVRDQSETVPNPVQHVASNMKLNQSRPEVSVKGDIPIPQVNHGVRPSVPVNQHGQGTAAQQKIPQNKTTHPNTAAVRNNNTRVWTASNPVGGVTCNVPRNAGQMSQPVRMSLMEDTPRQEPTVTATKQDTSMYSDSEGIDMFNSNNMPRKKASKFSVDKSAIDKGSSGYEEVQHTDGKVERVYSTGAREILFSNGTRKEISADGQSIVVSFFNGDIKQMMPDQTVKYYYAEAQTTHSTYPDGLEILQFPNNQVEKHYPDGTKEITFPDQTIKYLFPNGSEESIFPDGTVIRIDKAGDKTMEFPNGQREIHTQEYKRREYPDGTVKTVYPDGRQETRYSNGRIRVKDRDGNIIIDRRC